MRLERNDGENWTAEFTTRSNSESIAARAVILALGGASWPQTGSNGSWVKLLHSAGIKITPLAAANCGYEVAWPADFLEKAEGLPLKNVVVRAGTESIAGELLITKYGLEGGAIYQLGRALRAMPKPAIEIDLKPSFTMEQLGAKIQNAKPSQLLEHATRSWRLSRAAVALLQLRAPFVSAEQLAALTKCYPLELRGPRPIEEAISTAGGVSWDELDDRLMLKKLPGLFCAGEMIDWDAPTGGYLLQGCFSTSTRAAKGALAFLQSC
jgi:hypothetical protein